MSTLPVIVAPYASGVTQEHLNKALVNLIIDRVHELGNELARIGQEVGTLGADIEKDDELSEHTLARALRIMDTMDDRLQQAREALNNRGIALHQARAKYAAADVDNILKLSA